MKVEGMTINQYLPLLKHAMESGKCEEFDNIDFATDNAGTMWIKGIEHYEALVKFGTTLGDIYNIKDGHMEPSENISCESNDYTLLTYSLDKECSTVLQINKYEKSKHGDRIGCTLHCGFPKDIDNSNKELLKELALIILNKNAEIFLNVVEYVQKNNLETHFTMNPRLETK